MTEHLLRSPTGSPGDGPAVADVAVARRLVGRGPSPVGAPLDDEARAALARILATPGPDMPAARRWVAGTAAAALVAAIVGAVALGTITHLGRQPSTTAVAGKGPGPTALVDFTTDGSVVVARITDPTAAASQLTAAFRQHGLDISVRAEPVSPSLVGTIVEYTVPDGTRRITSLVGRPGQCVGTDATGQCPIGLVVPADFRGSASVVVGRAALPGERYDSAGDPFSTGEALHCSGLLGQPAAAAAPVLARLGLHAEWASLDATTGVGPAAGPPPTGYIVGGNALSATTVELTVSPVLPPPADEVRDFAAIVASANQGC